MDIITGAELKKLANVTDDPCVSIYLPTHRGGPETIQDPVRFKNLLARARRQLIELDVDGVAADELLAPATALPHDDDYWRHLDAGLALFLCPGVMYSYRVPVDFDELVTVSDHFHLKPLFPVAANGETYYLLALSLNDVRVFRGSRFALTELPRGDIPASMSDALWYLERERQLQSHAVGRRGQGRLDAGFHGHAGDKDTTDDDVLHFLQAVDAGFRQLVGDSRAPLVLAGVTSLVSTYRRASHYQHIVGESLDGNPERLGAAELRERAWPVVSEVFDAARRDAENQYESSARAVTDLLPEAVSAAREGRVESIFVAESRQVWGWVDPETLEVSEHDEYQVGDRDLLDVAAVDTLTHGGRVFALESSRLDADVVAAVLRY